MSAQPKFSSQDKTDILRNLPEGTTRIQVTTSKGRTCWKRPEEVGLKDILVFNAKGEPVVMRGNPGRKARVVLDPLNDHIAEVLEAKAEHLKEDPLLGAVRNNPDADDVLNIVMAGLAGEAASLEFERQEAERHGRDTSTLSLRRANILKATGEMWIKRREKIESGLVDLDNPAFEIVFGFMLETFRGVMVASGMRPEQIETVFSKLSKQLQDGWKTEAKARMREGR